MTMTRTAFVIATLLGLAACGQQDDYVGPSNGIFAMAISEDTPPAFVSEDGASLFMLEMRVELPIEPPTAAELSYLESQAGTIPPFARPPWVERDDVEIEVDWSLTNLTDQEARVAVTMNGFNEFFEYVPTFEEDAILGIISAFSQWERDVLLEPYETYQWTVRPEEMDEVATDLATIVNGAPNSNLVVHFQNHSSIDARVQPYIPATIPGLTGFRLGIRAVGGGDDVMGVAPRLVLEASVRLRDLDGKIVKEGDEPWVLPVPEIFYTVMPEEE